MKESTKNIIKNLKKYYDKNKKKIKKKKIELFSIEELENFLWFHKNYLECCDNIKGKDKKLIDLFFKDYLLKIKSKWKRNIKENLKLTKKNFSEKLKKKQIVNETKLIIPENENINFNELTENIFPIFNIVEMIWKKKSLTIKDFEFCRQYHYFLLGAIIKKKFKTDLVFRNKEEIIYNLNDLKNIEICNNFEKIKVLKFIFWKYSEYSLEKIKINVFLEKISFFDTKNIMELLKKINLMKNQLKILPELNEFLNYLENNYENEITKTFFEIFIKIKIKLENKCSFQSFQIIIQDIKKDNYNLPFTKNQIFQAKDFILKY